MRRLSLALAAAATTAGLASTAAVASGLLETSRLDPRSLYGPEIVFDVHRDGSQIGTHRTRFDDVDGDIVARTEMLVEVGMLFFTAYRYTYQAEGRWRDGRLWRLSASVDDDGDRSSFRMTMTANQATIERASGVETAPGPLYPTNHWNADVLTQDRVLNTLTGRLNSVRIAPLDREAMETERGTVMATRYAYRGDLETEAWYDDEGRWVGLRFEAPDGSTITYVCRRCQGGLQSASRN